MKSRGMLVLFCTLMTFLIATGVFGLSEEFLYGELPDTFSLIEKEDWQFSFEYKGVSPSYVYTTKKNGHDLYVGLYDFRLAGGEGFLRSTLFDDEGYIAGYVAVDQHPEYTKRQIVYVFKNAAFAGHYGWVPGNGSLLDFDIAMDEGTIGHPLLWGKSEDGEVLQDVGEILTHHTCLLGSYDDLRVEYYNNAPENYISSFGLDCFEGSEIKYKWFGREDVLVTSSSVGCAPGSPISGFVEQYDEDEFGTDYLVGLEPSCGTDLGDLLGRQGNVEKISSCASGEYLLSVTTKYDPFEDKFLDIEIDKENGCAPLVQEEPIPDEGSTEDLQVSTVNSPLDCSAKTIAFIGASNTVGAGKYPKYVQQLCAGSEVHVVGAEGKEANELYVDYFPKLGNVPYDTLVISPSGNGITSNNDCFPEAYYTESINSMITQAENQGASDIVVLTVSPRDVSKKECVHEVNSAILKISSYRPGVRVVDLDPVLDPENTGGCAFCQGISQIHWNSGGHQRVAAAIKGLAFSEFPSGFGPLAEKGGKPSATTLSQPKPQPIFQDCKDSERCREIDDAWRAFRAKVNAIAKVWVPTKNKWIDHDTVYATGSGAQSSSGGPGVFVANGDGGVAVPLTVTEQEINNLAGASAGEIKSFITNNFGSQYIEDVEYLTRILSIERGCSDVWKKERGAIAQVVINRIHSLNPNWGSTVKDVVAKNGGTSWFGAPSQKIQDSNRGIDGSNVYRGCLLSALKFMNCVGLEDSGANQIGGRDHFVHRKTQVALGREVPEWNYVNPVQVQDSENAAHFSGEDLSQKACSQRLYRSVS